MELALIVYIISVLSSLYEVFVFVLCCGFVLIIVGYITLETVLYRDVNEYKIKQQKLGWKQINWAIGIIITSLLILTIIPSERTMYTMVGAYTVQKVSQDPAVARMSNKVITIIEQKLDSYIQEKTK